MTVTQTWRVGPRSDREHDRRREIDSGRTLTLHRKRLTVTIISRQRGQSQHRQELALGVNSFLLHPSGRLHWENGRKDGAAFEVEVNEAGAFYFGVRQSFGAKLNGRVCGWARLRFGDVVEVGEWRVRIEDSDYEAERTVVLKSSKRSFRKGFGKRTWAVAIAGVVMSAMAATLFLNQKELVEPATSVQQGIAAPVEEGSSEEVEIGKVAPSGPVALPSTALAMAVNAFGEQEFDSAVRQFRDGDEKAACERLRGAASAVRKNVWTDKALLFIKRRCESL